MPYALYWLKRDFRLADNPALTAALAAGTDVLPIFVLEPSALDAPETSAFHVHAQADAYSGLQAAVQAAGGTVAFAHGEVVEVLDRIYAAAPFAALHSHQETGGARTYARDRAVADWCQAHGVPWTEHQQAAVFRGPLDRDARHQAWEEFTKAPPLPVPDAAALRRLRGPAAVAEALAAFAPPHPNVGVFSRAAGADPAPVADLPDAPGTDYLGTFTPDPTLRPEDVGFTLTRTQRAHVQPVSERAAVATLDSFLNKRCLNYSKGMSSPNTAFYHCSRLSVHLAWGTVSLRSVYQQTEAYRDRYEGPDAGTKRRNLRSFLSRLHWHDHFVQRLETEVDMEHRPLNPNFWELTLENDPALLRAWQTGTTGFPMVDACVRCLHTTGYLNFRMRALLTSVAAHTLHLDFRQIDKPMARWYTDYEPGIHLSQLQMQAGMVGINTLRTYNPEKQFTDHDPEGTFVHRWVPELRDFSAAQIAARDLAVPLGDYPAAVVDRLERVRAYRRLLNERKYRPGGREITAEVFEKHGSRRGPRRRKAAPKAPAPEA